MARHAILIAISIPYLFQLTLVLPPIFAQIRPYEFFFSLKLYVDSDLLFETSCIRALLGIQMLAALGVGD